jgi:hypothetical protein
MQRYRMEDRPRVRLGRGRKSRWGKGIERQAGSGSEAGRVVKRPGTGSGQARVKNQDGENKRCWEKTGAARTNAGKLDKQDELATYKQKTQV